MAMTPKPKAKAKPLTGDKAAEAMRKRTSPKGVKEYEKGAKKALEKKYPGLYKKDAPKSAKKLAAKSTATPTAKPKVTSKPKPKKTTKPKLWGAGDPDYLKKMKEQGKKDRIAREKQQQGFVIE